jgi:hypothetical protein
MCDWRYDICPGKSADEQKVYYVKWEPNILWKGQLVYALTKELRHRFFYGGIDSDRELTQSYVWGLVNRYRDDGAFTKDARYPEDIVKEYDDWRYLEELDKFYGGAMIIVERLFPGIENCPY